MSFNKRRADIGGGVVFHGVLLKGVVRTKALLLLAK